MYLVAFKFAAKISPPPQRPLRFQKLRACIAKVEWVSCNRAENKKTAPPLLLGRSGFVKSKRKNIKKKYHSHPAYLGCIAIAHYRMQFLYHNYAYQHVRLAY